jgi:polyphosphate glucokinase
MSKRTRDTERPLATEGATGTIHTLSIDIGGTHIKCSVLDPGGAMVADRMEIDTPDPATPAAVLRCITSLAAAMPPFSRISTGFPGAVKAGVILTAPNLDTEAWAGFDLSTALAEQLSAPARVLNDAAVQGLGVVEGPGLECVLTLGTGVGCALYRHRRLILPMELGQHRARGKRTYDKYLGDAALEAKGKARWNRRLGLAIDAVRTLVNFDRLYIGGGNARKVELDLPSDVCIVSNTAGITGGVRLWEPDMEEYFLPNK